MRKYLPHVLIISFVFLLAPTVPIASYAGEIETLDNKIRKEQQFNRKVDLNKSLLAKQVQLQTIKENIA